ncbi:MAG: hypothetical protein WDO19_23705 [Bacteroidota bacterium]
MQIGEFLHGEGSGRPVILAADLFFDIVLLCFGIVNDFLFNESRILQVKCIAVGISIWIAAAIADRITVSIYFGSCIRFLKKSIL